MYFNYGQFDLQETTSIALIIYYSDDCSEYRLFILTIALKRIFNLSRYTLNTNTPINIQTTIDFMLGQNAQLCTFLDSHFSINNCPTINWRLPLNSPLNSA